MAARGGKAHAAATGFWSLPGDAEAERRFLARNAAIHGVRCRIEKVFGTWKRGYGLALRRLLLDGPDVQAMGLSAWTLPELCREVEARWGVAYHPGHMSKVVRRLGPSRHKAWPSHPEADRPAREAFAKGGCEPPSPARFAATRRGDEHAVLVLDKAGWHVAGALEVPGNVTLAPPPAYSPQINPVERVWPHLRERHLSHRLLDGYD